MEDLTIIIIYIIIVVIILLAVIGLSTFNNILVTSSAVPHEADVVIVGGGVAGCIMARQLHQYYPDKHIVLLDRGYDYRNDPNVYRLQNAIIAAYTLPYSEVIKPDFPNVLCSLAMMYGGGSSHNFGLVVHGSEHWYRSQWCRTFNVSYDYIQTLFNKINNTVDISLAPKSIDIAGRIGPVLQILFSQGVEPIAQWWNIITNPGPLASDNTINAALLNAFDLPIVNNYNSGVATCSDGIQQLFINNTLGIRDSVNRAYLPTGNIYGPNLSIISNAEVDIIRPDRSMLLKDGRSITARDKLILSAGGIYTPYILKKSGFMVLSDGVNQIGENLTSHYGCSIVIVVKNIPDFSAGPLGFTPSNDGGRHWQVVVSGSALTNFDFLKQQGINVDELKQQKYTFISFLLWTLDPKAAGRVDVGDQPTIKLRLFENEEDQISITNGLRWLGKVYTRLKSQIDGNIIFPPEDVFIRDNDDELLKYAMAGVSVTDHYCRTCQYGTVLNDNFEIKGYKDIHVVDASAFPSISDGNTQYPTMVLAELAAERIKLE